MNKNNRGFTIIELLVVIAIIGVLAAIVLINVVNYINKGKDTAAKADMATLVTHAITYYNANSTFGGIKDNQDYKNAKEALENPKMGYTLTEACDDAAGDCTGESTYWCARIKLKAVNAYYCVDSSGVKKESSSVRCERGLCRE